MYSSGHLYSRQICKPKTAPWYYEPQVGIIIMIHLNLNINLAGRTLYNLVIFSQSRITVLTTFFMTTELARAFLDLFRLTQTLNLGKLVTPTKE